MVFSPPAWRLARTVRRLFRTDVFEHAVHRRFTPVARVRSRRTVSSEKLPYTRTRGPSERIVAHVTFDANSQMTFFGKKTFRDTRSRTHEKKKRFFAQRSVFATPGRDRVSFRASGPARRGVHIHGRIPTRPSVSVRRTGC